MMLLNHFLFFLKTGILFYNATIEQRAFSEYLIQKQCEFVCGFGPVGPEFYMLFLIYYIPKLKRMRITTGSPSLCESISFLPLNWEVM